MLKRLLSLSLFLSLVAPVASAAPPDTARQKFYDFAGSVHDGRTLGPSATLVDGTPRPEFERLFRIKKSFLPAIHQSGAELSRLR